MEYKANTYYGRFDDKKPDEDLSYFVLDEYLNKIIQRNIHLYEEQCGDALRNLKKNNAQSLSEIKNQCKELREEIKSLKKLICNFESKIKGSS